MKRRKWNTNQRQQLSGTSFMQLVKILPVFVDVTLKFDSKIQVKPGKVLNHVNSFKYLSVLYQGACQL